MAIQEFSALGNLARVTAGMKGGPMFSVPEQISRTIVEGWPAEVAAKLATTAIKQGTPTDPWNERRSK